MVRYFIDHLVPFLIGFPVGRLVDPWVSLLISYSADWLIGLSVVLLSGLVSLVRLLYADAGRIVGHKLNNAEKSIYITREI